MKKTLILLLTVFALAFVASATLTAQDQPTKVVFIDSQRVIAAHPAGQQAAELQQQAQEEIDSLRADLDVLVAKLNSGQQLSTEERERFDALQRSLQAVQQQRAQEIATVSQPAIDAVNAAIEEVALENGYTIVLDGEIAQRGLVVYAQEGLDITEQVIERIR